MTWVTFPDGVKSTTGATVTGLINGVEYEFQVIAVNSIGESAASNVAGPYTPTSAGFQHYSETLTTQIALSSEVVDSDWITFPDGVSAATGATVTGLVNGTAYEFQVIAVNSNGEGPSSNIAGPYTPLSGAEQTYTEMLDSSGAISTSILETPKLPETFVETLTTNVSAITSLIGTTSLVNIVGPPVITRGPTYYEFIVDNPPDVRLSYNGDLVSLPPGYPSTYEGLSDVKYDQFTVPGLRHRSGLVTYDERLDVDLSSGYAIAFLVNIPEDLDPDPIVLIAFGGADSELLLVENRIVYSVDYNSTHEDSLEVGIGAGWHTVVIVSDLANGTASLYIDGQGITDPSLPVRTDTPTSLQIGLGDHRYPDGVLHPVTQLTDTGVIMAEVLVYQTPPHQSTWGDHFLSLLTRRDRPTGKVAYIPQVVIQAIPDEATKALFSADVVRPIRWVDIFDSDNVTLLHEKVGVASGSVGVDMDRDERRSLDIVLRDEGQLGYGPEEFWYDKFIHVYSGIEFENGDQWATPLGQFMPDSVGRPHFPKILSVQCRDLSKLLMQSKFADTTTFSAGGNVGAVVSAIAANGGITKQRFTTTTKTLPGDVTFERGAQRWPGMKELAMAAGFEIFIDREGYLVFQPFVDPLTAPISVTFRDGEGSGNLATYDRRTNDARLFNDIIVYGSSQDNALVWARAQNTDPNSPTRISKIRQRTLPIPLQYIEDNAAAQEVADAFLSVAALEQYDVNFQSVVYPWVDAGTAIEFDVSDAAPGDPTRFLMTSLSIDLALGPMSGVSRRVIIVE